MGNIFLYNHSNNNQCHHILLLYHRAALLGIWQPVVRHNQVFHDKQIWQKSVRQINSGKINLLKKLPPVWIDLNMSDGCCWEFNSNWRQLFSKFIFSEFICLTDLLPDLLIVKKPDCQDIKIKQLLLTNCCHLREIKDNNHVFEGGNMSNGSCCH